MSFYEREFSEELRWLDTGIPERLKNRGLDSERFMDVKRGSLLLISSWVAAMPERQARGDDGLPLTEDGFGLGLLLVGPPGTGKTTLACAALTEAKRKFRKDVYFIRWGEYVQARRLTQSYSIDSNSFDTRMTTFRSVSRVAEAFLVVLDDVGHEYSPGSGYGESLLDELLRSRYDAGNPTIVTTNLDPQEWEQRYDATLRSFIRQACLPVAFDGPDLR